MVRKERLLRVWEPPKIKTTQIRKKRKKNIKSNQQDENKNESGSIQNKNNEDNELIEDKIEEQIDLNQEMQIEEFDGKSKQNEKNQLIEKQINLLNLISKRVRKALKDDQQHFDIEDYSIDRQNKIRRIIEYLSNDDRQSEDSRTILFIYGEPGSGKTYLMKKIASHLNLQTKISWFNGYEISSNAYVTDETEKKQDNVREIIIIDEFDRLPKNMINNKKKISHVTQKLKKMFSDQQNRNKNIKIVLISNGNHFKAEDSYLNIVKMSSKMNKIESISCIPYQFDEIMPIIKNRFKNLERQLIREGIMKQKQCLFNQKAMVFLLKKLMCETNDIRKICAEIINFLDTFFENIETNLQQRIESVDEELLFVGNKQILVDFADVKSVDYEKQVCSQKSMLIEYLKRMTQKQKKIFQYLISLHKKDQKPKYHSKISKKVKQPIKNECTKLTLYNFGSRLNISRQNMDLVLNEWKDMSIIKIQPWKPKFNEPFQANTEQIKLLINLQLIELKNWLY